MCYIITPLMCVSFSMTKRFLFCTALLFAGLTSADHFLHQVSHDESHALECQLCSNDITESTIEINKIDGITKEFPKNISATSLLDPQLSTSYSTRAPPII